MREFGAEVVRIDGDYDESLRICKAEAEANGWFVVSDTSWQGYTDPPRDVMAGYGVMTREACEACGACEAIDTPPTHVFLQGGGRRPGGIGCRILASILGRQNPAHHYSRTRTCPMPIRKRTPRHTHHGENPPRNHHGRSIMRRTFGNSMGNPTRRGIRLHHHPRQLSRPHHPPASKCRKRR